MIDYGKQNIGGVMIDAVDYEAAVERVVHAAKNADAYSVSALAVHGVMTGVDDQEQRFRLNNMDLVVPDGQPVRWAMNVLYRCKLRDRVYGPNLTLKLLQAAAEQELPVYFYGTTAGVLAQLEEELHKRFPKLQIAGMKPSRFRRISNEERGALVEDIQRTDAKLLFVGLGCPRQEVFAFELKAYLNMPIIAVGAAFPFIAGTLPQAPAWMQKRGLEWSFRLMREPKRLWQRYLVLNPRYLCRLILQVLGRSYPTDGQKPAMDLKFG